MERKMLITGIVLALSIAVIIGVVFKVSIRKTGSNPIKVIPQDAAYIIKLNGLKVSDALLDDKTEVWNDLRDLPIVNKINSELNLLDSLIASSDKFNEFVRDEGIYISGHYSGGRSVNHLMLLPAPENLAERSIASYLEKNKGLHIKEISDRKYEGKTIYSVTLSGSRIVYFGLTNNVLISSGSPVLIEDAIRQSTLTSSLLDKQEFSDMINTTGKNKPANLFVDFAQLSKISSLLTNSNYTNKLRSYSNLGKWTELDVNIKNNLILLNGFAVQDSDMSLLNTLSIGDPVKITVDQVLPSAITSFIAFGISDKQASYEKYLEYLKVNDKYNRYQANLTNLNSKYDINFEAFFLSLLDNEIALAYAHQNGGADGTHYLVFKCLSGSDTKQKLLEFTQKIQMVNNAASTRSYSPDNSIRFNIHKVPVYPLFSRVIGDYFNVFEECYITVVDNYMVVANSYKDASDFIYSYILNKTLSNDEVYRDYSENISMKSYALGYFNLLNPPGVFEKYFSDEVIDRFKENSKHFTTVQASGFQLGEVSNMPYLNIFLKRYGSYRGKPQTVWESLLDTTVSKKPSFVVNHYTKQNEIVIQDDKNNLYLLNQAGRILWKIPLSESINSEIFQIDYYKNNKLQILFSTKNYIHLLDRNGNYVENYPVRLRFSSTAGIALFDYDNNLSYRIAVPCADKKVYLYSKEGSLISGWDFKGTDYPVTLPIEHFRVSGKDYIVLADKNKTYILDRRGSERIILKKPFQKSSNNTFYLHNTDNISTSYLVSSNKTGTITKLYFDGSLEEITFGEFTQNHYFDFKDINADGKSDYVFLDQNTLSVYTDEGSLLFSKSFSTDITQKPVYYHFSHNNRKIGLVAGEEDEIYLINSNGELYKGFPLEGKTLFSIGYFDLTSSRFNLIVGGRNNFLYNYAVE